LLPGIEYAGSTASHPGGFTMSCKKPQAKTPNTPAAEQTTPIPIIPAPEEKKQMIPAVEEQFRVHKDWVEAGAVQIHKHTETRNETVPIDIEYEEVQMERV